MTELGEIPKEWEVRKLGEKAYIKARIGWRGLKAEEYTEQGPLLIAGKHIKGSKILWESVDHISEERYNESPEIQLKINDIIMSKDGTIGRVGFIDFLPEKATINGTMMLIRPNEEIYSKFIYYYFQADRFQTLIFDKVSGSSVPHIFQRDIVDLIVPIPPLKEQQKIADILSTVDEQIEIINKLIEKKKEFKKGLIQRLLTGKVRVPGFNGKWNKVELEHLIIEREERTTKNNQYRVITSSRKGIFYQDEYFSKQVASEDNTGYKIVREGDFVFRSMSDDGLFVFNQLKGIDVGIVSPAYGVFYANDKNVNSDFLKYIINSNVFIKGIKKVVQGGTRLALKVGSLKKVRVTVPEKKEQTRIAEMLLTCDREIELLEKELELLKLQKKGLMQNLLTGKIRVKC